MSSPQQLIHALPYFADSAILFASLADQPWAVFLDSAAPYTQQGRYDIFAAEPFCTLTTVGQQTTICENGKIHVSMDDPFLLLKQKLLEIQLPQLQNLPFNGGALGYFSYDLARRLERLPHLAADDDYIPDVAVGIYEWAVVVDHELQQSWLVGLDSVTESRWIALIAQFSAPPQVKNHANFQILQSPQSNMTQAFYAQAFEKIKFYLTEGDCYQVNLTQRFSSACNGNPWVVYQTLRQMNPAPFSAYLNCPNVQILSASPERFLKVTQNIVETKPIKGTRRRSQEAIFDQQQIDSLKNSPKDRAENVMIVDLLRNDLSKSCAPGSVSVPTLFAIETYATVHHLVSTVTGQLLKQYHALDLLRDCFPGGSITGAPKIRAMEIIEELEPQRRGVYCGAIGYIGFDGNMDTNIVIRTFVHTPENIRFWAGGGIVYDSILADEYQESFDKAAAMFAVLAKFQNASD